MLTPAERRAILEQIAEQHGGHITAELVIEMAKDPAHPLHNELEWDDAVLAHKTRLNIVRSWLQVKYVVRTNAHTILVPFFVRDPNVGPREQGYIERPLAERRKEDARKVVNGYLERIEGNIRGGYAVAQSFHMETEFLAGLERIVAMIRKPKVKKRLASKK